LKFSNALPCLLFCNLLSAEPSVVKIVRSGAGYQLLRNGQAYFTKGRLAPCTWRNWPRLAVIPFALERARWIGRKHRG
jgi:hypothetical protein